MKEKILPIETFPYVRSYTWHAFTHAIAGSQYNVGEKLAEFSVTSKID